MAVDVEAILGRALAGARLGLDEAACLAEQADLLQLGMAARELAQRRHGGAAGYTVDRTVVVGNACDPGCPYCAGTVLADDPRAFLLTPAQVAAQAQGAGAVILQGGHRSDLYRQYYLDLVQAARGAGAAVAGFSPAEVAVAAAASGVSLRRMVAELAAAGLQALWGAGAEAVATRLPEYRRLLAGPWDEWEEVVRAAAAVGLPVVAVFPFGLGEAPADRARFLLRIRDLQDQTGAFRAVVPLAARRDGALAGGAGGAAPAPAAEAGPGAAGDPGGYEYLRMVALARLVLDNVDHVQASPLTQGAKVAQVALDCGADDLGGTQSQFTAAELAAGRFGPMTPAELERLIADAGRVPVRRGVNFRRT